MARWERLWEDSKTFRSTLQIMAVVWGLGLFFEALVHLVLVYILPMSTISVVSPLLAVVVIGGLMAFSIVYGKRARKIGEVIQDKQ